jgi:hypothetical protein
MILDHGEDSENISDDLASELNKIYILKNEEDMPKLVKALYHQYHLD